MHPSPPQVRQAEKRTHLTAQQARVAETKERGAALEEVRHWVLFAVVR